MQYNTIPQAGTFGGAVEKMNANFGLTSDAIEQLRHDVSKSKGLYASAAALAAAIPSPQVGDWALVQGTNTIAIYVEDDVKCRGHIIISRWSRPCGRWL